MKKAILTTIVFCLACLQSKADYTYTDHRSHKLDSLENVVAGWTPERLVGAPDSVLSAVGLAYSNLATGYKKINPERSLYCARRALQICDALDGLYSSHDAAKEIGDYFRNREQYDSALVYYRLSLRYAERMSSGETSSHHPEGYSANTIDDALSTIYGSIGTVYFLVDSIQQGMDWYKKAGALFERNGWNENSAVLWYNMGEVWLDEEDFAQAIDCYNKSLNYGMAAGDSLWIATPKLGLGTVYMKQGKVTKALEYLQQADEYYSKHQDQEYTDRILTLDVMGQALRAQKRQRTLVAVITSVLALLLLGLLILSRWTRRLGKANRAADEALAEALSEKGITIDEETLRYAQDNKTGALEDNNDACHAERSEASVSAPELTQRELEILPMIAAGLTSKEIAARLFLTQQTIKWRRQRLLEKFDARNTAEMLSKARDVGML